ncbi:coiled-coil domain-containing protein [Candidatus Spongiihabitans sp.]|uniref:coiled-coil domain-containing protein n=1 Tax=Candidatus Spongiihabitans sp. TaxID=3101308 RepID=UPI003C7CD4CE
MFDTLAYASKLKEAGFTERQAKAQVEALVAVVNENLATKEDIELIRREMKELDGSLQREMKELSTSLRREMKELSTSLRREMKELSTSLQREMKEMELKFEGQFSLIKWMLGVTIATTLSIFLKTFFA